MGEPRGSPPTGVGVCMSVHMGVGIWWWMHGPHGLQELESAFARAGALGDI